MPSNLSPAEQLLYELFETISEDVRMLRDLLNKEFEILQQADPEPLHKITAEKQRLIEKIDKTLASQNAFLEQQGLPSNRQGIEAYLQRIARDAPIHQQWKALEQQFESSQKQNEINGALLTQSRRQIGNALDILQGFSRKQNTYGPSGESRSTQPSKLLGSA
jgi:flagellar biosynthesis/type III secretory pathway chaperone